MPKLQTLSVITVCYNSEKTIGRTLKSLNDQIHKGFESIVIDGGSTDKTVEIVKSFGSLVHTFLTEKDEGIYDAMNKGIALITGTYVAFLNSDDIYFPHTVADILSFAEKAQPEIIYGNMLKVRDWNGDQLLRLEKPNLSRMPHEMSIFHPSTFIRRDILEKYGLFDTTYTLAADYHWMLRAYLDGVRFEYLDKTLVQFFIGGQSNFSCKSYIESAEIQRRLTAGTGKEMMVRYKLCNRKKFRNRMIKCLIKLPLFKKMYEVRIRQRWT